MNTGTIFDVLQEHPNFKYEAAKNAGHSDKEILEFLADYPKDDTVDYMEVSAHYLEDFRTEHPYCYFTIISLITGILIWLLWKFVMMVIKSILYQISYSIKKGVNDADYERNRHKF